MNILLATSSFPRYDGDYFGPWVVEYANCLALNGHRVFVVAPQSETSKGPSAVHGNVEIVYFQYLRNPIRQKLVSPPGMIPSLKDNPLRLFDIPSLLSGYNKAILDIIEMVSIDIFHAQWAIPSGYALALMSKKYRIPLVVSTLGAELYLSKFHPFSFFSRFVFNRCSALFAVSEQMRHRAITFGVETSKIHVLPNSVDPLVFDGGFTQNIKSSLGIPEDSRVLLTIRRLVEEKRVDDVLKAISLIEDDSVHLIVGGDGPLRQSLEGLSQELGIKSRCHFVGFLNKTELRDYYGASDIYVLSSEQEGLSLSLLEAMSSEVIPIATIGTGSEDVVVDGLNGHLFQAGRVNSLVEKISATLLLTDEKRSEMSRRSREAVVANFSTESIISEWESVYRSLLS